MGSRPPLFGFGRMRIDERANGRLPFIAGLQVAFDQRRFEPGRAFKGQPFKDSVAFGGVFLLHGVGDLRRIFVVNQRLKRRPQCCIAFAYRKFRVIDFFLKASGCRGLEGRSV